MWPGALEEQRIFGSMVVGHTVIRSRVQGNLGCHVKKLGLWVLMRSNLLLTWKTYSDIEEGNFP